MNKTQTRIKQLKPEQSKTQIGFGSSIRQTTFGDIFNENNHTKYIPKQPQNLMNDEPPTLKLKQFTKQDVIQLEQLSNSGLSMSQFRNTKKRHISSKSTLHEQKKQILVRLNNSSQNVSPQSSRAFLQQYQLPQTEQRTEGTMSNTIVTYE